MIQGDSLKRIIVYSESGARLFSGNMSDLPFDEQAVTEDAVRKYGERLCPQRIAAVKQTVISKIFTSGVSEVTVPAELIHFLRHKEAFRIKIYNE
jgi:hypothetical protein